MRTLLLALTALVLASIASGCGSVQAQPVAATTAQPVRSAADVRGLKVAEPNIPDFALRDQNGAVVRLSAQRGKVVLLTFLYTDCRDVCPLIASNLNLALLQLTPAQRREVRVVAVTVDPVHDTRSAVRRFIASHHLLPQFRYLTGIRDELRPIWQGYNLLIQTKSVEQVSHSAYVLLVDRSGKARLYYGARIGGDVVAHDLRCFLTRPRNR
jgi:protein SCO1/2